MATYRIEIKNKNGEWQTWQTYDQEALGHSTKERCEAGLKIARCYGECRVIEG